LVVSPVEKLAVHLNFGAGVGGWNSVLEKRGWTTDRRTLAILTLASGLRISYGNSLMVFGRWFKIDQLQSVLQQIRFHNTISHSIHRHRRA